MVVASGGWVQNANYSSAQSNSNLSTMQNNKMTPKVVFICRDNSHPFQERTLSLEEPVKIGRSVARARAAPDNAIFDCKVLSRNHALLWYSGGKFYLQDTRSSNGTFINNQRLSSSGFESVPKEVCSGDIVQFGVDVVENTKKVTHGCIVATLKLYLPDGTEAKASLSNSVASVAGNVSLEDLYKLYEVIQDASRREKALYSKLGHLQQLVDNTRKAADQSWKALIAEDRLLSWVETVENQLVVYSKNYTEDKIRNELVKLLEEKAQYQNVAKEAIQKILQEKLEVTKRLMHIETQLSEAEEENQSLHSVTKYTQNELQELSVKYKDLQKKLQDTTNELVEIKDKLKEVVQNAEQEKNNLLKRIEDQAKVERNLQARLRVNIHKQITALRNYMQTLQDRELKFVTGENIDSKDEENPIEAINSILNKLNSISADNMDNMDIESNLLLNKSAQDNNSHQFNLLDADSNQLKTSNVDSFFSKVSLLDDSMENGNLSEYILPLASSKKTLVNGNVESCYSDSNNTSSDFINTLDARNTESNSDVDVCSESNSEATDETCSVASDDVSEKSIIENKKEDRHIILEGDKETEGSKDSTIEKNEVRFSSKDVISSQEMSSSSLTAIPYDNNSDIGSLLQITPPRSKEKESISENDIGDNNKSNEKRARKQGTVQSNDDEDETGEEQLDGDYYIKTLKPKGNESCMQQSLMHSKEYILQMLISSLDSLKGEDSLEAQQVVKRELEELRNSLIREPSDTVLDRLKEMYYRAKNEAQRIQEVSEELVIVKEKYNAFLEERGELLKKYTTLKQQCGDLLNASYSVPIHYVVPIVIALVWMLLEKIF